MLSNFQRSAQAQSDDRLRGARRIGALNGTKAFRDSVGLNDKIDHYTFKLTGRSSFNLSLKRLQNNVDVFLLKAGRVIARSAKGGRRPEAISTTLDAGTYYVRVNQRRGNSRYRLTLNATPLTSSSPSPSPSLPPSPSPQPSLRKLVSLLAGGESARLGLLDMNTGNLERLPLGNLGETVLLDLATFGNETFAVGNPNNLYKIDPNTSTYTFVGSLGVSIAKSTISSLGFAPSGTLYAAGSEGDFYTVDTATGKANLIATIPGFSASGDIVYDATSGRFLATSRNANGNDSLYSIGLAGDARLIGNIGFNNIWGLLFNDGILYGLSPQQQIKINPTTGAGTLDKVVMPDGPTSGINGAA